jgi:lysophospholipase L1-like esterase
MDFDFRDISNTKIVLIALGAVAILLLVIFLIFGRGPNVKNYPPKSGPIVAFGDSLVSGYGSTKGNDFVSLVSQKIGEPIINLGVSGNTSADGLARINDVLDKSPRITILLLGGNDFLKKLPIEQTSLNLRQIIKKLQDNGSIVVLVGVRNGLLNDTADDFFEDLADRTGSLYISNVLAGIFSDTRYMSDAVHPNNAGYAKIAERIAKEIKPILR